MRCLPSLQEVVSYVLRIATDCRINNELCSFALGRYLKGRQEGFREADLVRYSFRLTSLAYRWGAIQVRDSGNS
jgi:hypothetical protein